MSEAKNNDISQAIKPILALHQAGAFAEALTAYARLLESQPKHPLILSNMGMVHAQLGQLDLAIAMFKQALAQEPSQPATLNNLAGVLQQSGAFEEAEHYYRLAIELRSDGVNSIQNLAGLMLQTQRFEEAHKLYKQAISKDAKMASVYYFDALALKHLGRTSLSILRLKTALKLDANLVDAYHEYAVLLQAQNKYTEAIKLLEPAITLHPNDPMLPFRLGLAAQSAENHALALRAYDQAVKLDTKNADAFNNRGLVLSALKRHDEALGSFDMAIYLAPTLASAYNNRGATLRMKTRYQEAIACFEKAAELHPKEAAAYNNKGLAYMELGEHEQATAAFETALKLDPDYAQAHFNLGVLKLRLGDYAEGWAMYEWRWQAMRNQGKKLIDAPLWLGEKPLINQTLLVHAEQGLGDTIQCARYVPLLKQFKPNQIVVEVPESLFKLFNYTWADDPQITVIKTGQRLPHVDAHCPMMSLPLAFKTRIDSIPHADAYLEVEDKLLAQWQHQLGGAKAKRVGIVWSGSAMHSNDAQRSIQLKLLEPLFDLNIEWHCLQDNLRTIDRFTLRKFPHIALHHQALTNLSETAALIMQLDLVISVDTSVAHLAAALGKPVWLLLPFNADFRWLTERNDSPWYASMSLFRQTNMGDYETVIAAIKSRLTKDLAIPGVTFMPTAA